MNPNKLVVTFFARHYYCLSGPKIFPYFLMLSASVYALILVYVLQGSIVGSMQSPSNTNSGTNASFNSSRKCFMKDGKVDDDFHLYFGGVDENGTGLGFYRDPSEPIDLIYEISVLLVLMPWYIILFYFMRFLML